MSICQAYECDKPGDYWATGLCIYHYRRSEDGVDVYRPRVNLPSLTVDRWWTPSQPTPCMTTDPELWFPDKGGSTRIPKALCGTCPEIDGCRDWADLIKPTHGIWAGQSVIERRATRRERATV